MKFLTFLLLGSHLIQYGEAYHEERIFSPPENRSEWEWSEWETHIAYEESLTRRHARWYYGTFYCDWPRFCASVYYVEADVSFDDSLAYVGLHCTNTSVLRHAVEVLFGGGDGWYDFYYNPTAVIYHDCGHPGVIKKIYSLLPVLHTEERPRYGKVPYERDITDLGVDTDEDEINEYTDDWDYTPDPATSLWAQGKNVMDQPQLFEYQRLYWFRAPFDFLKQLKNQYKEICIGKIDKVAQYCYWVFKKWPFLS